MSTYNFSSCDSVSFSTNCPLTEQLMNAIMTDNQQASDQACSMIHARNDMRQMGVQGLSFTEASGPTGGKISGPETSQGR